MGAFLADVKIIAGPLPLVLDGLAIVAFVLLAARLFPERGARIRWSATVAVALTTGAVIGVLTCWLVGDVFNAFDVFLGPATRFWVSTAFASIALALANLWRTRARRRIGAVAAIVLFTLMGALGVNADFGQYATLGSITDAAAFTPMPHAILEAQRSGVNTGATGVSDLWRTWIPPAGLPAHGVVGAVTIPATVSHFGARTALVYLPPAALVPNPPMLPVLVMLSGQPGSPQNIFVSGHLDAILDQLAATHNGLAPIVVVPDQLTAPGINPMCVDSPIGNSATYLTVDVPRWIRANLAVASSAAAWAIGGYSQGGTCAIQLGGQHPELFGSFLDISGQIQPKIGTDDVTIALGFGGSKSAWEAAKPLSILARNAPYVDEVGVVIVGALDVKYSPGAQTIADGSNAAGIHTTLLSSPGTDHDWNTVKFGFEKGLPTIYRHMGIESPLS